jgi:hypothetical protein
MKVKYLKLLIVPVIIIMIAVVLVNITMPQLEYSPGRIGIAVFVGVIVSALIFVIYTLLALPDDVKKNYATAYKIFLALFILGIPTVVVTIISIALFIGTTAELVAYKTKTLKNRAIFYTVSLTLSTVLFIFTVVNYEAADDMLYAFLAVFLAGLVLLGLAGAFLVRLVIFLNGRFFDKKVQNNNTGVNMCAGEFDFSSARSVAEVRMKGGNL